MAEFIALGETVEGAASSLCARKWEKKGLKIHPETKKRMLHCVGDRNSSVKVTKESEEVYDQDTQNATSHYHRNVGDLIKADSVDVYVDAKRIDFKTKEGVSGRHGANLIDINKHTIGTIRVPLNNIMHRLSSNLTMLLPQESNTKKK